MWVTPRGNKHLTRNPFLFVFFTLTLLEPLCADHTIEGVAPVLEDPDSIVVVSPDNFLTVDEMTANLVLPCTVTAGDPVPVITWFRGGVELSSDSVTIIGGSLLLNITTDTMDGVTVASRTGVRYYCSATNTIGSTPFPATVRSRDILVYSTFFDGFERVNPSIVSIATVQGGAVALECDFQDARPVPDVNWYMDNGTDAIGAGRYLFISSLTAEQRAAQFHCEVTNALLSSTPRRAPTIYTLSEDIAEGESIVYELSTSYITEVGSTLDVQYAAAFRAAGETTGSPLAVICSSDLYSGNGLQGTFSGFTTTGNMNFTCSVVGGGSVSITFDIQVTEAATITGDDPSEEEQAEERERLVGVGTVMYVCESTGFPDPTITWYFNGELVPDDIASVNGKQLDISSLQVVNSGVYECIVTNTIDGEVREDRRQWVLEVRMPIAPTSESDPVAKDDRLVGSLIVVDEGTPSTISLNVTSDPCPTVMWSFKDVPIPADTTEYTITNPCDSGSVAAGAIYTFSLTIPSVTEATSGSYTAEFTTEGIATSVLASTYVTSPVAVNISSLSQVVDAPGDLPEPSCLLEGSDVVFTCNIEGFPRPNITFIKDSLPIPSSQDRISMLNFDQIQISSVEMSDEGQYTCTATRDGAVTRLQSLPPSQIFCTLPGVSSLILEPESPSAGEQLELRCTVSGTPIPTVIWFKDGNELIIDDNNDNIIIVVEDNMMVRESNLRIVSAGSEDSGDYMCVASNDAGSVESSEILVEVSGDSLSGLFTTGVIIGIVAGGVGLILIIVLVILLLICVYLCAKRNRAGSADFAYNVDYSAKPAEYGDGRGNVDADSFDGGGQPEAFDPDYDSVPTRRPMEPPPYKATPGYQGGMAGEDLEMIKYPPQDDAFVTGNAPYSRPAHDNGGYRQPSAEDFLSEDAQFV